MAENCVMERKKQIFQLDGRLKDLFNQYCSARGLIQEQVLEAMVYMLVEKDLLGSADRDNLLQEVASWKSGTKTLMDEANLNPGEAGQRIGTALQHGAASRKRSQRDIG